ncbi:sensor histidine kinase [Sinorhizobium medicae]|uniref:histidine kinase n=1 Tax=Sinorhizobium medicae TaxID=110321 RepID=A0A508WUB6_9HYPH|nr:histidine kinase dimerization/phospho-acceptor domain-containing protein [Sinorhizobium medicae]MBO1959796.1 sensor histidine kinase N-terminal domain-containing protein [Sinorhizobium medicae]MDX0525474.1 two-component sensor histidine kinase [Sinorhizobium medicae]MDX0636573.1 two-component sensor histidine kinase [Sinorhizobium medicae]MDX0770086.1 two-component sensor histidine kinase [Sinorhizobium medicae]MDX0906891.1 two-component sensor histidine kinase [Sinorhizobium medicae]
MRVETRSLAGRLVLSLSLLLAVFWTIAVGLSIHVMRAEFDEVFDSALQETTERLASLVVDDYFRWDAGTGPNQVAALNPGATDEYLTYQVRDASGRVLLHSHNIGTEPYPAPLKPGFWSGNERRIFTIATVSDTLFVQVADSLAHRREATLESALTLLLPILLLLPLGMFAVRWVVVRATRPVNELRDAISTRDGSNLEPIVLQGLPTEIAAIPGSVNTLLGRLKLALQAERDLAANSAHELRTPLAGALAQMELLADQLTEPDDRSRSDRVLEALRRLSLMLEKLLQLSRAEAGIGASSTSVDLLALVKLLVESFQRSHQTATIELRPSPGQSVLMRAVDPDAFAIAFNNLLENAARYGTAERPITVAISADGRITVTNAVSVPLDPDLDVYRARFRRGQTSKPGSGLGLAIVDKLIAQMDGTMILRTVKLPDERTGFECELSLPPPNQ